MAEMPKVVTAKVAARLVGLSESTLAKLRLNGNGPIYCKLGRRVVYRPADLEQWLQSRTARDTSDADARFLKALTARTPTLKWDTATPTPGWQKSTAAIRWKTCRDSSKSTRTRSATGSGKGLTANRRSAADLDPWARTSPLPDRPPGACEADLRSRPHLLPAVPRAEGARREDGRMHPDRATPPARSKASARTATG